MALPSPPFSLTPIQVTPWSPEFHDLLTWPFPQQPFYQAQVLRLLGADIPFRIQHGNCRLIIYRDPNGNTVGFGTLDVCSDYQQFTSGRDHTYIPVLAVH